MIVDTDDLVDVQTIAKRAGVSPAAVSNWTTRHELFPDPVWTNGKWSLWLWWQVRAWLEHTGRGRV